MTNLLSEGGLSKDRTVRGDSHFCSHNFMDWAKLNDRKVFFITGLSANSVLLKNSMVKKSTEKVKHQYDLFHHPVREFGELYYKADSWTLAERVVVKVEMTQKGEPNIRFIVTNIRSVEARSLYETTYCGRGKYELYIRQFKKSVSGDRLSCHTFKANRLRIFLYAAAYILKHSLRERALKGTSLERASLLTVRERLLLSVVCIRILKTKIWLDYAKHHPMKRELRHVMQFYEQKKVS